MKMIQLGCGGNRFPEPWENYDRDIDVAKPLPFFDDSTDLLYCSHLSEHLSGPDCFRFFQEVHRILKPGGVFRVVVPSITRVMELNDQEYFDWIGSQGLGTPDLKGAIQNLVCGHGHLIFFSDETLWAMLAGAGFSEVDIAGQYGISSHPELCDKEWHGRVIGEHNDRVESLICEAKK